MKAASKIYTALVLLFLYAPIIVMIVFSFNGTSSTSVLSGFSFQWYKALLEDETTLRALSNTVVLAVCSSLVATVLGTAAAVGTLIFPDLVPYIGCSIALYAGYSVSLPVLQNMAAVRADPAQKNLVMGFYNATKSLGSIIGSLMAGFLYGIHNKLPFLVVAVAYGLSVAAAVWYFLRCRKEKISGR